MDRIPAPSKEIATPNKSPRSTLSLQSSSVEALSLPSDGWVDNSIKQLYDRVCYEIRSPSTRSFGSDRESVKTDSELQLHVEGDVRQEEADMAGEDTDKGYSSEKSRMSDAAQPWRARSYPSRSRRDFQVQLDSNESGKSSPKSKSTNGKPPTDKPNHMNPRKANTGALTLKKKRNLSLDDVKLPNLAEPPGDESLNNPHLGPILLRQACRLMSAGDDPEKALEYATQAAKSLEICANGKPSLQLVMSLHVMAVIYCNLGHYDKAIPVLEHSIEIPIVKYGQDHALAKFAGHMQLGDTYAMLGQLENAIECYTVGLEVQKQVLGELDPRVGETYRYMAEAHLQALQLNEAEKLCRLALDIHKENGSHDSIEEAADRRLMGIICDTKGDHEAALEYFVLASMAMVSNGQVTEVASVDCSIGDAFLSLSRYEEAVYAYHKSLTAFKTANGDNHPTVASVFVRLADLYNKMGKGRESMLYCESARKIYENSNPGNTREEIANGLADVSAIYESLNEPEEALDLLHKSLKIYEDSHGQQITIAGIEAQIGVLYYMHGNYPDSYSSFKNAITRLRGSGETKSAFFGITLNQMGLVSVRLLEINEAASLFEEALSIMKQEYGHYHPETLGVYSNLAGTYDAMGRLNDAIEILEYVVRMREEKLGTANPEVDDEKRRLSELLKEAGRNRNREGRSLETLFHTSSDAITAR